MFIFPSAPRLSVEKGKSYSGFIISFFLSFVLLSHLLPLQILCGNLHAFPLFSCPGEGMQDPKNAEKRIKKKNK